jgi:hypothetical protein
VSDSIAQDVCGIIRLVPTKRNGPGPGEIKQLFLAASQQRTHQTNLGIHRRDARPRHSAQTFRTRTAQQPQQKQFNRIVGMMSQRHTMGVLFPGCRGQKSMARVASGHLHRNAAALRPSGHSFPGNDTAQPKPPRQQADESFVAIALFPPQLVIEMSNDEIPPMPRGKAVQNLKQDDGIDSTGNRDEHGLAIGQQPSMGDIRFDFSDQPVHAGMLKAGEDFSQANP